MTAALLVLLTALVPVFVQTVGTSDPWRFWLGEGTTEPLQVWNRGSLDAVEKRGVRDVRIVGPTRIGLISPRHTEFRLVLYATGSAATDGIRLRMRTTERDYAELSRGGIALTIDRSGVRIEEGTTVLAATDTLRFRAGDPIRIAIEHDGQQTRIAVGCSLFGPFRTQLPATEYTIVEPLGDESSSLQISDVAIEGVRD
ncbi:MAG: hypothetical protein N3B17_09390 [Chlorobi bacterium]|nr:hypothetical protein [Chlorobiota bacterium]